MLAAWMCSESGMEESRVVFGFRYSYAFEVFVAGMGRSSQGWEKKPGKEVTA